MVEHGDDVSQITQFFNGSTVFLTGATGYLGGMFMEKLIRACDGINKIYVLIRPKKGKDVTQRFDELFDGPAFEPLKTCKPNYKEKVAIISGDLLEKELGISNDDRERLINEVDLVIHCAASVRFDEHLKKAAFINVRSLMDMMKMAKEMKNLKVFLYISTAYSNCTVRDVIEEKIYDTPRTGQELIQVVEALDDEVLEKITPTLLGKFPNTYAFTKAIAENEIKTHREGLPIAIHRPSIVVGSIAEPVPGWINNLYGLTGIAVARGVGLLRVLHTKEKIVLDIIPADVAINSALAAMWDVDVQRRKENVESNNELLIYNCVSGSESPVTVEEIMRNMTEIYPNYPINRAIWHSFSIMCEHEILFKLALFFLHTGPAHLVDFLARCIGKEPKMVKIYQKLNKFVNVCSYFLLRQFNFQNDNVQKLWNKLGRKDRELYPFSMSNFDWRSYFHTNIIGGRVYILQDPMDTIPQGRILRYKLMAVHYLVVVFLWFLLYWLLKCIYNFVVA